MNNNIHRIFLLIYDDTALVVSTNLSDFFNKVKELDIGYKPSLSTIRNRFLEKNQFSHTEGKRIYWFQKIENDNY